MRIERKNSMLKDIIGFSFSSIGLAVINFISIPIISRFFSPDQVGRIAIFISYVTLVVELLLLGIGHAFLRLYHEYDDENKEKLLGCCILLTSFISIAWIATFIIFIKPLSFWIFNYYDLTLSIAFCMSVTINMWLIIIFFYDRARNKPVVYSIQVIILSFTNKLFYVAVAINNGEFKDAVIAIVFGQVITLCISIAIHFRKIKFKIPLREVEKYSRAIFTYALPLWISSLIVQVNNVLPVTMAKNLLNFNSVGIFTMTVNVGGIMVMLTNGFSAYWNTFIFSNYKKNIKIIQDLFNYSLFLITIVAFLMIMFQDLIYLLIGKDFEIGKYIFPIIILNNLFIIVNDIGTYGIYLSNKTVYKLVSAILTSVLIVIFSSILVPTYGLMGLAMTVTLSSMIAMIFQLAVSQKHCLIIREKKVVTSSVLIILYSSIICIYCTEFLFLRVGLLCIGMIFYIRSNRKIFKEISVISLEKLSKIKSK